MTRARRCALLLAVTCGLSGSCSCGSRPHPGATDPPPAVDPPSSDPEDALYSSPGSYDFSRNPLLLDRIVASPHGYFRFINVLFSEAVCRRFAEDIRGMPAVNLHGDAHVEQYAVTDVGRGLTDFDDSSTGPFVIDLVRYGTSVVLALEELGLSEHRDALLEAFFSGYRASLEDPAHEAAEPAVVARLRATFPPTRATFLADVETMMEPLTFDVSEIDPAIARYSQTMHAQDPDIPSGFFDRQSIGRLHVGVGSALDEKYLLRIRGPTADPDDDVVLEVKEVRDLEGISCLDVSRRSDPFRILVAQSRIAYRPYRYLGYVRWRQKTFWIHAWEDNYAEVEIGSSFRSPEEVRQVLYDSGVQLGRGHPLHIADPLDLQLRRTLQQLINEFEQDIRRAIDELSGRTRSAWERFRSQVPRGGTDAP
jgi:hypothetical protein